MRKCNVKFNQLRAGFPRDPATGKTVRAANTVAKFLADKGVQVMQSTLLQNLCIRFGTFKVPLNTAEARMSQAYSGPARKTTEVFA